MKIAFSLLFRFRTHMFIIWGQTHNQKKSGKGDLKGGGGNAYSQPDHKISGLFFTPRLIPTSISFLQQKSTKSIYILLEIFTPNKQFSICQNRRCSRSHKSLRPKTLRLRGIYSVNSKQCLTVLTVTSSLQPSAPSIFDGIFVVVVVVRKRLQSVHFQLVSN